MKGMTEIGVRIPKIERIAWYTKIDASHFCGEENRNPSGGKRFINRM